MPAMPSAVCFLALLSLCSACFISNCPLGGKRATPEPGHGHRQCMACGPGDRGHCFGPNICCGEGLGCYMGTPETARCLEENYLASPCEAGGRACGPERGHCAALGVCCDEGQTLHHSAYTHTVTHTHAVTK
ncbi:NEU4 protein, partial [Amia calva]|nr:NEU4 protein [Amia calva]